MRIYLNDHRNLHKNWSFPRISLSRAQALLILDVGKFSLSVFYLKVSPEERERKILVRKWHELYGEN